MGTGIRKGVDTGVKGVLEIQRLGIGAKAESISQASTNQDNGGGCTDKRRLEWPLVF